MSEQTSIRVNAKLDASGQTELVAGNASIVVHTSRCLEETPTLLQCLDNTELLIRREGMPEQHISVPVLFFDSTASLYRGPLNDRAESLKHTLLLSDVNNDGVEDLLVWTGKEGAYAGASFDIFLADPATGKFHHSHEFSELTQGYNGLFTVEGKHLKTAASDGCCTHIFETYEIQNNKPVLIERITEDSTDPSQVIRKKEALVNGILQEI